MYLVYVFILFSLQVVSFSNLYLKSLCLFYDDESEALNLFLEYQKKFDYVVR